MIDTLKAKKSRNKKDEGLWLLSFADLSMILISFFILMLSFANVDKKKVEQVAEQLKQQNTKNADVKPDSLLKIEKRLNEALVALKIDKSASITYDITGLSIEFKDSLLFEPGSSALSSRTRETISSFLKLLAHAPNKYHLRFEGHTDDVPINSDKLASNWELSAARGIALMREFEKLGVDPTRMSVLALADTKPKVEIKGLTGDKLEAARLQNRRVVIRVE